MLNCKHIFRMITYSINAHPVIALMFSQTGTDVLPRRNEGSDKPSASIEPHSIMVPTRTRTQAARLKVRCRYHYTTAAHFKFTILMACRNVVARVKCRDRKAWRDYVNNDMRWNCLVCSLNGQYSIQRSSIIVVIVAAAVIISVQVLGSHLYIILYFHLYNALF